MDGERERETEVEGGIPQAQAYNGSPANLHGPSPPATPKPLLFKASRNQKPDQVP